MDTDIKSHRCYEENKTGRCDSAECWEGEVSALRGDSDP